MDKHSDSHLTAPGIRGAVGPPVIEVLPVPGARLYTETRGAGPLLLCIVGGNGDAEVVGQIAGALAARFTVVTYDRRGYFAGGHVGYVTHRAAVGRELAALLAARPGVPLLEDRRHDRDDLR